MLLPWDLEDTSVIPLLCLVFILKLQSLYSNALWLHQLHSACHLSSALPRISSWRDSTTQRYGPVEAHIDASGFQLLNRDLPSWYINAEIKVASALMGK